MELANIPFSTFPQNGLVWGTEPSPAGLDLGDPASPGSSVLQPDTPYILSIVPIEFSIRDVGTVNSAYPAGTRVATQGFVVPIGLLSATLSTSMVNATTDSTMAVIVARDVGATISLAGSSDILLVHFCEQGLSHSMRSGVGFADDIAPKYGSNDKIAIYVVSSGTGFANNRTSASVILRYFPLPI